MRRASRSLVDVREELAQIQTEFILIQPCLDAARESVTDVLTRIFGEQRPAFSGMAEDEIIERIGGRVVARLTTAPKPQSQPDKRYVRDVEAAMYLGVSPATLRSWRSRREPSSPPVTRMGKRVMYSVKGLEQYMEERTVEGR